MVGLFRFALDLNVPKFMKGVKAMRINIIDTVRKNTSKIYSIPSATDNTYYSTNYDRSTVPAFLSLLKSPKQPDEAYTTYPQVLFTNYKVSDEELFGSSAILNVSQFAGFISATAYNCCGRS